MPPRRNAPIDPGQHMSVGGNHRQYTGSSGMIVGIQEPKKRMLTLKKGHITPQAISLVILLPVARDLHVSFQHRDWRDILLTGTGNILPQMRNAPQVEHLLPAGAHNLGMHVEDVGNSFNDNAFGPNQDRVQDYQHHHLPLTIGREDQTFLEDTIQHPPRDMDNDKSDKGTEFNIKRRKPKKEPKRKSAHAKKLEKVPGGAGSDFGPRGRIQETRPRGLEYWDEKKKAWIPAVFHCTIRDKLINKAKTCDADVYRHPRARGMHELDVTAFLESQRDWQLERDHGWVVKDDVLYMFAKLGYETPTNEVSWMSHDGRVVLDLNNHPLKDYPDIPLTLSSKVEGSLMETIWRIDNRITEIDMLARLPGDRVNGAVFGPTALTNRTSRFRRENCVPSWVRRKGTQALTDYLWDRMSPAARAANSTRELSKLSKQEQEEAKQGNIGNHDANAGGYALRKEGKEEREKQASTTSTRQLVSFDHVEEEFPFASGTRRTEMPPPRVIDYRSVPPRNEVDIRNIQDALEVTRSACSHQISSDGGPTTIYQSYSYQLQELLNSFAALWESLGGPLPVPHLQTVGMLPWMNGFNDWRIYVDPIPIQMEDSIMRDHSDMIP